MTENLLSTKNPMNVWFLRQKLEACESAVLNQYIKHFPTDNFFLVHALNSEKQPEAFIDQYLPTLPSIQLYEKAIKLQIQVSQLSTSCFGRCGLSPLQTVSFQQLFVDEHSEKEVFNFILFLVFNFIDLKIDVSKLNLPLY